MAKYDPEYLDEEEKEIIEELRKSDFRKAKKPTEKEQKEIKNAAKEFLKQEAKMNIRIDPMELKKIKERASQEGLRYQTFIKSVLHKYLTGQLVEKEKAAG
jgi:predicted DNA binding CopG/RHH family protein